MRQLVPERPDPRVARRDVDVRQRPGANLPPIDTPEALGGVLKLGGALRVPGRKRDVWDNWDGWFPAADPSQPPPAHPHPFQEALAGLVNLADAYLDTAPAEAHARLAAADPGGAAHPVVPGAPEVRMLAGQVDPVVTPPLYGKWHAATSRLLRERDGTPIPEPRSRNWVHRLNLDPRFRIAANFGTQVVQARQEEFMAAAWAQVGEVLEANKRIRQAQLAREVGHALQKKHLDPPATSSGGAALAPAARSGRALRLTAPAVPVSHRCRQVPRCSPPTAGTWPSASSSPPAASAPRRCRPRCGGSPGPAPGSCARWPSARRPRTSCPRRWTGTPGRSRRRLRRPPRRPWSPRSGWRTSCAPTRRRRRPPTTPTRSGG
ncbi:hypothetical protein O1M54_02820 [Streptomyces diastatochromogenes]|nr:hypothetical protein [Streptomyces diastatochromogenes]